MRLSVREQLEARVAEAWWVGREYRRHTDITGVDGVRPGRP